MSGAPKIKAIELIYELEKERRGVYAGAVGRFDFADDEMDTCIAIRTMTFKDGIAYLQAGGGIVYDSVEEEEYVETINKLKGNVRALERAERTYTSCVWLSPAKLTPLNRVLARYPSIWCWHLSVTPVTTMYGEYRLCTLYNATAIDDCLACPLYPLGTLRHPLQLLVTNRHTFAPGNAEDACYELRCPSALIVGRYRIHDDSRVNVRVHERDGRDVQKRAFSYRM